MAYLDSLLLRGERIKRRERQHPIALAHALGFRILQLAGLYLIATLTGSETVAQITQFEPLEQFPAIRDVVVTIPGHLLSLYSLLAFVVVVLAVIDAFRWRSVRVVVTDQRILFVSGLVTRVTVDTPLDRIGEVALAQSLLGEKLDYGDLWFRTVSLETRPIEAIVAPVALRKTVEKQRLIRLGQLAHPGADSTNPATAGASRPAMRAS